MARNVYNQKDIDSWIQFTAECSDREEVAKWIKSTVRRYIYNDLHCYHPVECVEEGMPEWAIRGVEEGTLEELDFDHYEWNHFSQELEHALIFVDSVRGDINVSFRDAVVLGNELIRKKNEKASEEEDWSGLETLITTAEGFSWVEMKSMRNLIRESKFMQHCVGQSYHYIKGIEEGRYRVFSLRDQNNQPHCTIQLETIDNSIIQIQGKQNTFVVAKYHQACSEFLSWLQPSRVPEYYMRYLGLIQIGDAVYNVLALPDGLEVQESLNLAGYGLLDKLPSNLTVHGNLSISRTNVRELPFDLYVGGTFNASGTPIKSLPPEAYFGGSIIISDTEISHFPYKKVNGTLNIRGSYITSLPSGCTYFNLIQHFMQLCPQRVEQRRKAVSEQVAQSNLLVDTVLSEVSKRISRKVAHELRMLIAKRSDKFEFLMGELRRRGIDVS